MPRTPDPELEDRIVAAALRLLDRGGDAAVTMRAVASEAATTTPTIYERFQDRDALMLRVVLRVTDEAFAVLQAMRSVEQLFSEFLRFNCQHPLRFNVSVQTFGARRAAGDKMPVFDLLKSRLTEELGVTGNKCEELALAITSLAFGTVRGMVAAGVETHHASELRRASLSALRLLLKAFSGTGRRRPRSRGSVGKAVLRSSAG